jgi:hypothetical protein
MGQATLDRPETQCFQGFRDITSALGEPADEHLKNEPFTPRTARPANLDTGVWAVARLLNSPARDAGAKLEVGVEARRRPRWR